MVKLAGGAWRIIPFRWWFPGFCSFLFFLVYYHSLTGLIIQAVEVMVVFWRGKNRSTRSTNREFLGNGKCFCFVIRDVPICPIGFLFLKLAPLPRALLLVVFFFWNEGHIKPPPPPLKFNITLEQLQSNRKQSSNHPFRGELLNFRGVFFRIIRIELKKTQCEQWPKPWLFFL